MFGVRAVLKVSKNVSDTPQFLALPAGGRRRCLSAALCPEGVKGVQATCRVCGYRNSPFCVAAPRTGTPTFKG